MAVGCGRHADKPARTRARIASVNSSQEVRGHGDKGPGSKGGGKKPKTSTKKRARRRLDQANFWLNSRRR